MNIIFFSNSSWSIYNFRKNFIRDFIKEGYDVYIVSNKDYTTKYLKKMGCKFIELKFNTTQINFFKEIKNFFGFLKIVFNIKPKVVYSFTLKPILYSTISSRISRFKVVNTFDGLGRLYDDENFLSFFYLMILKIFNKNILKIILVNKKDYKLFKKKKVAPIKKLCLIKSGTGIDTKHYDFRKINNFNVFLFLGRFLPSKGIIEFCEAAKKFKKLNKKIKFFAAGNYSSEDKSILPKKKLFKYKKFVNFYFNLKDVRDLIGNATCIILPSYYNEGLNRSLMESLSMGRIIMTTNIPGCYELLNNQRNGFKIKRNDVRSIGNKIDKVLNLEKKKIYSMSKICRKFILDNYSDKKIINKYIYFTKLR